MKSKNERDQNKAIAGLLLLLLICGGLYFIAPLLGDMLNPDEGDDVELVFAPSDEEVEISVPELHFEITDYDALEGWQDADMLSGLEAFKRSCEVLLERPAETPMGGTGFAGFVGDWHDVCASVVEMDSSLDSDDIRQFFEAEFTPYIISDHTENKGLFTGYYVPDMRASSEYDAENYPYPLYARPDDLIMVNLGDFREELRGQRIAGRAEDGMLVPYASRSEIEPAHNEAGALDNRGLELYYAANAVDVFFLQIQGSGRLILPDESTVMLGYAGQNGHPYFAIGRALIDSGEIAREDMSMQAIREWLEGHPDEARGVMNLNESYVFFTELEEGEAVGAEGVGLTAGASLAVDLTYYPLGIPMWLETENPDDSMPDLHRLMIAQDTGGAIRGVVRGDVFWGYGEFAGEQAGKMNSEGRLWVLLPNNIEPELP